MGRMKSTLISCKTICLSSERLNLVNSLKNFCKGSLCSRDTSGKGWQIIKVLEREPKPDPIHLLSDQMFFYWNDQSIFQRIPQDYNENGPFHICFFKSSSVAHKITLLKYLPSLLLIFLSSSVLTCFTEKINVHRKWDFVWTFFSVFERSEFDSILPKCFSRNHCSLN